VEHPVTEVVYGVDLVCEQIRLALGEPLSLKQDELEPRGHAIECRVYAEDPLRNFAPSPGRISLLISPDGPGVRVDSGVVTGSVVPLEYDPMLAKLVVWAADREGALARLERALKEYRIRGIATTLPLFRTLVDMEEFRTAAVHTGFLDELLASKKLEELQGRQNPVAEHAAVVAAACLATLDAESLRDVHRPSGESSQWWDEGLRQLHGRFPR
jgi:acetyl/propionyl-CoA carboxylase alpha subunit